jgi:hypothetical protein
VKVDVINQPTRTRTTVDGARLLVGSVVRGCNPMIVLVDEKLCVGVVVVELDV